jgi:hypothetical protein
MRTPILLALVSLGATTAAAEPATYHAERGYWTVYNTSSVCRAVNRPPADFNYAPFNALQIAVRPGDRIAVEVFFWPGAVDPAVDNALALGFGGGAPLILPATAAMGDFMLASEDSPELWGRLQKAKTLSARVKADPNIALAFSLDQIDWVLTSLQMCSRTLPDG